MPCFTIETACVEFDLKVTNLGLFQKAMEKLGYRTQDATTYVDELGNVVEFAGGKLVQTFRRGKKLELNQIKQEYARQTIRHSAKKMGWALEEKTELKGRVKKKI